MELTIEAALSPGGLLGHLSYLLLVVSMLSRSMVILRLLVIASAFPAIAYDVFWLKDPVGLFWETLLVAVNIVQLSRIWLGDRAARLDETDRQFAEGQLRMRSRGEARRLIDTGDWVDLPEGARLTEEGARPEALYYLASGEVDIRRLGTSLGSCVQGSFVGEMALLEDEAVASATAVTRGDVRAWRLPYAKLERLERAQPSAFAALQAAIARDLRLKIVETNNEAAGL